MSEAIWLNGRLSAAAAARIDPADRGLLLGDGVFETLAVADGRPLRLAAHLARLRAGAAVIGLPVPLTDAALTAAMAEVLDAAGPKTGSLRLTLTRGVGPRGLPPPPEPSPTVMLTAGGLPPETPAHVIVAQSTRRNEHSPLSRIKSLNYLDNILARMEAQRAGADDALVLNTAGRVAEASAACLFWVKDGALFTPPIAEGALPGVRRAGIIAALGAAERPVLADELRGADEIFLANSLSVRPVASLDGRPVGWGGGGAADRARRLTATDEPAILPTI